MVFTGGAQARGTTFYADYWKSIRRGIEHVAMATLDGMRERTVTINGMSKTYSVTGWRIGYAIAHPDITDAIRKVHDFLTVGAAAPLQEAGVYALSLPRSYYQNLQTSYQRRRDFLLGALEEAGIAWTYKQFGRLTKLFFAGDWGVRMFVDSTRIDEARSIVSRLS